VHCTLVEGASVERGSNIIYVYKKRDVNPKKKIKYEICMD